MKIAIIGSYFEDSLEFNLKFASEDMGYEAKVFNFNSISNIYQKFSMITNRAIKVSSNLDDYLFNKLSKKVIDYSPDLIIATWRFINPIFVENIKKGLSKTKIVHLNPDAITTFGRQEIFMSDYDAYFTKCLYTQRFMRDKLLLNVHYLPESFNPFYHTKPNMTKDEAEKKVNIDVMMIGTLYRYRYKFIKNLIDRGVKVKIFGNKPNYIKDKSLDKYFMNEYVTGKRKSELFYGAKIVLNNFHYAEVESVNCKFFEIAGSGGVQLCDSNIAVDKLLKEGEEVFTFNSIDDAVNKIDYLLKNPELRFKVSKSAFERSLKEHTYRKRIEQIMEIVY